MAPPPRTPSPDAKLNDSKDVSKCPVAHNFDSQPMPTGFTKPTELLTNGKTQCPFFMPKTYGNGCADNVCHLSHMVKHDEALAGFEMTNDQIWEEAHDYIREYYYENKLSEADCIARLEKIKSDIYSNGYYEHAFDELSFGVKTCWRNARRCIMRSQWNTMTTIDARHITKGEDIINACFHHLDVTRNGGRIKPHVTIFPQKKPGKTGARIWSEQLLRYAGYKMADGTIIGDSANLELTARAVELGWTPKYGKWDVLPLIVNEEDGAPIWREIPDDLAKQVYVTHPQYEWFGDLGLRWFDHPPVSAFGLSIGGIEYNCAPFSGWYMSTEIASRDLADEYRYNALPDIARNMGLPMNNRALWKDRAVLELNTAVLYSWDKAKTTMVDHHSASDSFITHYEKEIKNRGHCPADWVWITPPASGATTKVFHQEMYSYLCKPAVLLLNEKPWETYWRKEGITPPAKISAHETIHADTSEGGIVIAYGTETGTALRYAEKLQKHLIARKLPVSAELLELDNVKLEEITTTLVVVTSSFGDGDPPANAAEFAKVLKAGESKLNARFAVFGLGSTLYSDTFQFFPKFIDTKLAELGGRRIIGVGSCDEMDDPESAFESWMIALGVAIEVGSETTVVEDPKVVAINETKKHIQSLSTFQTLAVTGGRAFYDIKNDDGPRAAYNIELTSTNGKPLKYVEGDHISILPPSKTIDICEDFVAKWGDHLVENIPVSRILREFVEWSETAPEIEISALQILAESNPIAENLANLVLSLPMKRIRNFSISSTPLFHPASLNIAVARVEDGQTSLPMIDSVRSRSLQLVSAAIRTSKFRLPSSVSTPIVLVGTGTGTGPLRGMMHGRLSAPVKGNVTKGSILCVLGFRTPEEYFYRNEFEDAAARGVECFVAYSRAGKKEYVGDVIVRESNKIVHLLESGAMFYVCGSTAMGKSVEAALAKGIEKTLGIDALATKTYMATLRKEGRFNVDTYSRANTA